MRVDAVGYCVVGVCSWQETSFQLFLVRVQVPRQRIARVLQEVQPLLPLKSGPIWLLVTRLVTENPREAQLAFVSADEVSTRPRLFAWVRASHLPGIDAHPRIEIEPALSTKTEVAVLLGVP